MCVCRGLLSEGRPRKLWLHCGARRHPRRTVRTIYSCLLNPQVRCRTTPFRVKRVAASRRRRQRAAAQNLDEVTRRRRLHDTELDERVATHRLPAMPPQCRIARPRENGARVQGLRAAGRTIGRGRGNKRPTGSGIPRRCLRTPAAHRNKGTRLGYSRRQCCSVFLRVVQRAPYAAQCYERRLSDRARHQPRRKTWGTKSHPPVHA